MWEVFDGVKDEDIKNLTKRQGLAAAKLTRWGISEESAGDPRLGHDR
ncbi:hypothetical protein [Capillibacterium thermochitinicola]|nr:hypothetical protein [Capillibacterium thermochitinicola]